MGDQPSAQFRFTIHTNKPIAAAAYHVNSPVAFENR